MSIMRSKNFKLKIAITVLSTALFYLQPMAQGWNVPADKKAKNSYLKFDDAATKEGEGIYTKNCQSCHGNPGKNNSLKSLKPTPPDMGSANTQTLTDGELSYILSTGRGLMPSFKNTLAETERWKVISFIRSFNKNYVQVQSKSDPSKSNLVKIAINFEAKTNKVTVHAVANEKSGVVSLKNSEVVLFANRYFGRLQIDQTLHTDVDGNASFSFPTDLPGNKTGEIELIVKINDDAYGEIESIQKLKIGVPTDKPSLRAKRAIWNTVDRAPIWIIIVYSTGVLTVVAFLLYLILNLLKLKKIGNN
jgi:mono/diheme cytochrome c family protein